jgi:3-deoxy-D-manno-octulosonic-acid transferase
MGAPPSRIKITGNIKYDSETAEKDVSIVQQRAISDALGISAPPDPQTPLIVAGSTHENEEEALFTVLGQLRARPGLANTRLLIAPRHPQRFDTVAALAAKMGFRVVRRSAQKPDESAEVLVLDTLGELAAAYAFASVVFVGGTLIPHGGHSILEPATHSKAIVIGPHMENFPGVVKDFRRENALRAINVDETNRAGQIKSLTEELADLLSNQDERDHLGAKARAIFDTSRGATQRTFDHLVEIIKETKP